jgi:hypothetical protein
MCNRNSDGISKTKNGIDKCLHSFVKYLNSNGIKTVFSCCGHGSENPYIKVTNIDDVIKMLTLLDGYSDQFITNIEPFELNMWKITYNGLVCSPPRYPSWADSKENMKMAKDIRNSIFKKIKG